MSIRTASSLEMIKADKDIHALLPRSQCSRSSGAFVFICFITSAWENY